MSTNGAFFMGRKVRADYRDATNPNFKGNPLYEALPRKWSEEEVEDFLIDYPKVIRDDPNVSLENRLENLMTLLHFYQPLPKSIEIERSFSLVVRDGYFGRNPIIRGYMPQIIEAIEAQSNKENGWVNDSQTNLQTLPSSQMDPIKSFCGPVGTGFDIFGISGIGKTDTAKRILSLYPQVIYHSDYHGIPFCHTQLVWLFMECPFDGSLGGLCRRFFLVVDRILETDYINKYGKGNIDTMLEGMAIVAAIHSIGVLVIDELQYLNEAKSGGAKKMLDFFVNLNNTIGIPIVPIGTYAAYKLFGKELRLARKTTGIGDIDWPNMKYIHPVQDHQESEKENLKPKENENDTWELFMSALWKYRYVKEKSDYKDFLEVMYDETQGITDFAIKVFLLAQKRAIESKKEKITIGLIKTVGEELIRLPQNILNALRSGNKDLMATFDDIYVEINDRFVKQFNPDGDFQSHTKNPGDSTCPSENHDDTGNNNSGIDTDSELENNPKNTEDTKPPKGGLLEAVKEGATSGKDDSQSLKLAGFIREIR